MSIKDKISVHPTGRKFRDDLSYSVKADVYRESKESEIQSGFSLREEHMVEVRLGVFFRCNKVELSMAEARAREQLIHELYVDQRSKAFTALNAVCSGDRVGAMEALDSLIQSMNP